MAEYLGYPFDPELFSYNWENAKDPTLTAMFESGAVAANAELERLISNGSDFYTLPFYKVLGGTPDNYDGSANITISEPGGGSQSGVVYGRAHGWKEQDFIVDYTSGADPMKQITSQVNKYWQKNRQSVMLKILDAVFQVKGSGETADWEKHITDISASGELTTQEDNMMNATTIGEAIQTAVGDNMDAFKLVFMHSKVATNLAGLQLLEFLKYTDANGVQRPMRIGIMNGMTVIVDDGCPYITEEGTAGKYTTYVLGAGALQYGKAPVKNPVELTRDAVTAGGYTALITRLRETIHPNGFSFKKPSSGYTSSPTDAQLAAKANWSIVADPKTIALVKIVTNG